VSRDAGGNSRVDATAAGAELHERQVNRRPGGPLSSRFPSMTLDDAYAVQEAFVAIHVGLGAQIVGHKVGCTNRLVQQQFGIDRPDYGHLLDRMVLDDRARISIDELIQPRIEPEIAFLLKKSLDGPRVTIADVIDATEGVIPCFEIIDSRIEDWRIKFVDTVADNGSSALCVLGDRLTDPRQLDLPLTGSTIEEDGELLATGAGAAALGHPAAAVAWLASTLLAHGQSLRAGHIVLPGALTPAMPIRRGSWYEAKFARLGSVRCQFQ